MSSALHTLVRVVHVLGMAVVLGGAAAVWQTLRANDRTPVATLRRFESVFWVAIGLIVATGVGNLGALGPPGPSTRWGSVLTAKLFVVLGFVVLSIVRSLAVLRVRTRGQSVTDLASDRLRLLYANTVWVLVVVVVLAEVLAHG
ncbi:CopD family protein [Halobellus salinisoli]|uniref:CopD family protein n=1 Tax=Halobellus salinisoli TaxID=3108500 RepID=UPI00300B43B2